MSSTSSANALFTGTSQFSSDLQQVIQRAVSFASLPMQQMQNDLTTLQSQQSTAQTLNSDFATLQSAVAAVESSMSGTSAFRSSVSTPAVASVGLSGTPMTGTYTLTVNGMGVYATAGSDGTLPTVSNPDTASLSDASSYTLSVGDASYTIVPSGKTLIDLANALNVSGQVQATLVNLGSSGAPDYHLSLEGTQLGDLPIQLTAIDGTQPGQTLVTPQDPPGAPATYQVNGQPSTPISTTTPVVTIAPGVTATLTGSGTTTVTVSASTAALSNALSQLATAYNTAMADVNKNRGQAGGALAGDSLIVTLSTALRNIAGYSNGSSGISSLTSLGFSFDQNGVLSFDPVAFATATNGKSTQLEDFLGSSGVGGSGFLQSASATLNGIEDSASGLLTADLQTLSQEITAKNQAISDQQQRVNQLQTNLQQQMDKADAAIAGMEQQLQSLQGYFADMQTQQLAAAGL